MNLAASWYIDKSNVSDVNKFGNLLYITSIPGHCSLRFLKESSDRLVGSHVAAAPLAEVPSCIESVVLRLFLPCQIRPIHWRLWNWCSDLR